MLNKKEEKKPISNSSAETSDDHFSSAGPHLWEDDSGTSDAEDWFDLHQSDSFLEETVMEPYDSQHASSTVFTPEENSEPSDIHENQSEEYPLGLGMSIDEFMSDANFSSGVSAANYSGVGPSSGHESLDLSQSKTTSNTSDVSGGNSATQLYKNAHGSLQNLWRFWEQGAVASATHDWFSEKSKATKKNNPLKKVYSSLSEQAKERDTDYRFGILPASITAAKTAVKAYDENIEESYEQKRDRVDDLFRFIYKNMSLAYIERQELGEVLGVLRFQPEKKGFLRKIYKARVKKFNKAAKRYLDLFSDYLELEREILALHTEISTETNKELKKKEKKLKVMLKKRLSMINTLKKVAANCVKLAEKLDPEKEKDLQMRLYLQSQIKEVWEEKTEKSLQWWKKRAKAVVEPKETDKFGAARIIGEIKQQRDEAKSLAKIEMGSMSEIGEAENEEDIAEIITEEDMQTIYETSLKNIVEGYGKKPRYYPSEKVLMIVSNIRKKYHKAIPGMGKEGSKTGINTYLKHGYGQWDINLASGSRVYAVKSAPISMLDVDGEEEVFRQSGPIKVKKVSRASEMAPDKDVLVKLKYGLKKNDPRRVIAACSYENVILGEGLAVSTNVEGKRKALLEKIEEVVLKRARAHYPEYEIPGPIFRLNVNASAGQPGWGASAHGMLNKVPEDWKNEKKWKKNKKQKKWNAAMLKITKGAILDKSTEISENISNLVKEMEEGPAGLTAASMPALTLAYTYQSESNQGDAYVAVRYGHLGKVLLPADAGPNTEVAPGDPLGIVTPAGNAISPHIHMEIRLFRSRIEEKKKEPAYAFLDPVMFFKSSE